MLLRKVLLVLLIFGLTPYFTGCTSKNVEEPTNEVVAGSDVSEEDEDIESDEDDDLADSDEDVDEDEDDLTSADNDTEEESLTDESDDLEAEGQVADQEVDDPEASEPQDVADATVTDEQPALEEPAETETLEEVTAEEPTPVKKSYIPVKKIALTPFEKNTELVNAVYIARPNDSIDSVSQKIFGVQEKRSHLLKVNPNLNKGIKPGDKVYYNSPQRPGDQSRLLTFYEDAGLSPEIYISKPNENIRTVSAQLLGHKDGWKEVWATNADVVSKGDLPGGTKLRYWSANNVGAMKPLAAAEPPPVPTPPPVPVAEEPPPLPSTPEPIETNVADASIDQQSADSVEPPPIEEPPPVAAAIEEPPPPPPPEELQAEVELPPPPPPQPKRAAREMPVARKPKNALGLDDPDQMMALGAGAILILASVALFIIIRKKKASKKPMDFNTQTQASIE